MAETWLQLENFASTTANGAIDSADLTIVVTSVADLPALFDYYLLLWDAADYDTPAEDPDLEVVKVTSAAGLTLTVTRAQAGTIAADHPDGATVELPLLAEHIEEIQTALDLNTTHRTSNGTDHGYIDQDVTSGSSPTFDGANFSGVDADDVDIADSGDYYTGTEVETALQEIGAGLPLPVTSKAAIYTLAATDAICLCTGTFTVTLPTAAGITGKVYYVKNISTGVITVDGDGAETIDGDADQTLHQWDTMQIASDGTNWVIL